VPGAILGEADLVCKLVAHHGDVDGDGPRCSVASAERAMSVPLRLGAPGDARTSTAGLAGTTARETMARTGTTTSMTSGASMA